MASHTHTELRMAAEIFAEAARRQGLEPSSFLAPAPEPAQEIDEVETALARAERIAGGSMSGREEGAFLGGERDPSAAPRLAEELRAVSSAPFDFERDSSPARAA
jgi:hypothetical protein